MPLPAAAIAVPAAASLLGGVLGNRSRSREAAKNRRFQERMRNTQWQAGVADMEKAGLNPALAYQQGGAASPSGSMASQDDVISPGVSSGQEAMRLKAQLKLMKTQETQVYMDARLKGAQTRESAAREQMVYRQQKHQEIINELGALSLFSARNMAGLEKTRFGSILPYLDRIRGMAPRLNLNPIRR